MVRAALTVRFRQAAAATGWRRAAWVVQLFGAILLFAVTLRRLVGHAVKVIAYPEFIPHGVDAVDGTRAVAWAVVVIAALLGWRLVGFAGAAAGLAGEIAVAPWSLREVLLFVAGAFVLLAVIRQEPAMRRWMLAWAAPVLVTVPLIRGGFAGFVEYNARHPDSLRMIGLAHWAVLVLIPLAAFVVVAVSVRPRGDKLVEHE